MDVGQCCRSSVACSSLHWSPRSQRSHLFAGGRLCTQYSGIAIGPICTDPAGMCRCRGWALVAHVAGYTAESLPLTQGGANYTEHGLSPCRGLRGLLHRYCTSVVHTTPLPI